MMYDRLEIDCKSAMQTMVLAFGLLGLTGCSSSRVTDPPKTATELYLLSTAIEHAVAPVSSEQMRGRLVYVDRSLTPEKEQDYLVGAVRAKLLTGGARLTNSRELAEVIVEIRTPGVGIDRTELLVGIPGIPLGAVTAAAGVPGASLTTPELALIKNLTQWGTAGVAIVAYWRESGELIASSGPHIGRSYREDWTFFGFSRTLSNIAPTRVPEVDGDLVLEEEEPLPPPPAPSVPAEPTPEAGAREPIE